MNKKSSLKNLDQTFQTDQNYRFTRQIGVLSETHTGKILPDLLFIFMKKILPLVFGIMLNCVA
jgi:hypothetical protein